MTTTIDIRACTNNDIGAVLSLDREWEQESVAHVFIPISRDEFVANLAEFPECFFVAAHQGRIIGYINGSVHLGAESTIVPAQEPYATIENLYVQLEHRHNHVGGQLIERFVAAAHQRGIQRFLVGSNSKQMDKILALYRGHGFKLWSVQLYRFDT